MAHDHHDHDDAHGSPLTETQLRVKALESLLDLVLTADRVQAVLKHGDGFRMDADIPPRFKPGDHLTG